MNMFKERRINLIESLNPGSAIILYGARIQYRNADSAYAFRQDSNFWYLSGFNEADSVMLIIKDIEQQIRSMIFVPPKDKTREIWDGYRSGPDGAINDFGFDKAYENTKLEEMIPQLLVNLYQVYHLIGKDPKFDKQTIQFIKSAQTKDRHNPNIELKDLNQLLMEMRVIKSDSEIQTIKKACEISAKAHNKAMQNVQPKMNEYEIEALYLNEFALHGARFPAYTPIVAGGENACTLHYIDNSATLCDGDLLLVDAGCEYQNYASDITRTFPINGKFSDTQLAVYEIVLEAERKAIECVMQGNDVLLPQAKSEEVITQGLIDLGILKGGLEENLAEQKFKDFYMHKIGHWLGLDVHDSGPYSSSKEAMKFASGMITTIEPGIYISSESDVDDKWKGIGIRIEDDILVTESGNENLTDATPTDPQDIQSLMS
ncbi:aminopeptidase P N-terminal domain-containing protein [SAR86 cluster bacterium]|nr:aminopeptidase P N-terminal domain-containing protein [SAR86 cluster bacterium]